MFDLENIKFWVLVIVGAYVLFWAFGVKTERERTERGEMLPFEMMGYQKQADTTGKTVEIRVGPKLYLFRPQTGTIRESSPIVKDAPPQRTWADVAFVGILAFAIVGIPSYLGYRYLIHKEKLKNERVKIELEKARIEVEERVIQEGRAILAREDQQYVPHAPEGNWRKKRNKGKGKDTPSG